MQTQTKLETLLEEIFIKSSNEMREAQTELNAAAPCSGHCVSGQCKSIAQDNG